MNNKILIVEDEGLVAMDLGHVLVKFGYNVCGVVDNCESALEQMHLNRPDLVSMDIKIAGNADGIVTATKIIDQFHVPIIFLTCNFDELTLRRAKLVSPWFLRKPFNEMELFEVTKQALDHRTRLK